MRRKFLTWAIHNNSYSEYDEDVCSLYKNSAANFYKKEEAGRDWVFSSALLAINQSSAVFQSSFTGNEEAKSLITT